MCSNLLTDTAGGKYPDSFIWRITLWEKELDSIDREGEGDYRHCAGPDDHTLHPQPDECQEVPEGHHDVCIVRPCLLDHAPKLSIAVSTNHGEDAGGDPHHQRHVH